MIPLEILARIEADMTAAATMDLGPMVGYLAGYSARFDEEIWRGEVTRDQIRAYADQALERARTG